MEFAGGAQRRSRRGTRHEARVANDVEEPSAAVG